MGARRDRPRTIVLVTVKVKEMTRSPVRRRRPLPEDAEKATLIVLEEFRDANDRVELQLKELNKNLGGMLREFQTFLHMLQSIGRFVRRWVPWIIAVAAPAVASAPTIIKAAAAASGHPVPQ